MPDSFGLYEADIYVVCLRSCNSHLDNLSELWPAETVQLLGCPCL